MAHSPPAEHAASEVRLHERLEATLAGAIGGDARIVTVRRRPNRFSTLSPTEVLEIELSSGETMAVFVKRLGEAQASHPDKRRRDREPLLYERLLAPTELPVPRWLGIGRDAASGNAELYLEYLDGLDLRYRGLEHWYQAAGRLADLHRHFADSTHALHASDVLLALDARYYEAWAERAVAELAKTYPNAAGRLAKLVERLEPATELLVAQPATLVHNDLSPKNVVSVTGPGSPRVAFVDWELAGVGCGASDLVHLAYGLDAKAHRRLCDAYWERLEGSRLALGGAGERASLLAACKLHKALYRLAHASALGSDEGTVAAWVEEVASCRSHV